MALCELSNTATLLPCDPSPAPIARLAPAHFASGLGQGKERRFSISWYRSTGVSRVPIQEPDTPHTHHPTKVSACSPCNPGINVCDILRNGCAGAALRGLSSRLYKPLPTLMARAIIFQWWCLFVSAIAHWVVRPSTHHHSECSP